MAASAPRPTPANWSNHCEVEKQIKGDEPATFRPPGNRVPTCFCEVSHHFFEILAWHFRCSASRTLAAFPQERVSVAVCAGRLLAIGCGWWRDCGKGLCDSDSSRGSSGDFPGWFEAVAR